MPVTEKELPRTPIASRSSEEIKTGTWRTLKPIINREECTKCFICWKFCPDLAITLTDDNPEIDYDYCKGCGICANECPQNCIEMVSQELE